MRRQEISESIVTLNLFFLLYSHHCTFFSHPVPKNITVYMLYIDINFNKFKTTSPFQKTPTKLFSNFNVLQYFYIARMLKFSFIFLQARMSLTNGYFMFAISISRIAFKLISISFWKNLHLFRLLKS